MNSLYNELNIASRRRSYRVYAAYYGEQYEPIVTDANIDTITNVLHLGGIGAPNGRIDVRFEYKLGDELPRNNIANAKLWLEQTAG